MQPIKGGPSVPSLYRYGVSEKKGTFFEGSHNKGLSILGYLRRTPYFGKDSYTTMLQARLSNTQMPRPSGELLGVWNLSYVGMFPLVLTVLTRDYNRGYYNPY